MTSFLEELRAVRRTVEEQSVRELPVIGSGGRIVVRFRPPADRDKLTEIVAAYKIAGALSSDQERQLIVDCCDEILRKNPETGELEQFDDEGPLRFDAGDDRWGEDVHTARDCVGKLYNLDKQPLAATTHAEQLVDWLQGIPAEVEARVRQEAEGKG